METRYDIACKFTTKHFKKIDMYSITNINNAVNFFGVQAQGKNYFFGIENDRRVSFFAEKKEVLQDFSAIKIPA